MTAHDQIRAMLDQLMGTARNGQEDQLTVKFDDPKVCKSFLLGCCPHEILASTRMDLGDCSKIHNVALRADYEQAVAAGKDYYYDVDALTHLTQFIADCDRKTAAAKKRLLETQSELSPTITLKSDRVNELSEKIGESLAKAEQLGADGLVDESIAMMANVDALRKEKTEAEAEYRMSIPAAQYQQQKLRVCEVCCAYLGIHDNDRRLADHFGGKLHLGFIKIREELKGFQDRIEERRKTQNRRKRSRSPADRSSGSKRRRSRERRSSNSRKSPPRPHSSRD